MEEYICIFYETTAGKSPVEDFIESLDIVTRDKFIFKQQLLQGFGPQLRHPHTDYLGEGIFELRFKGIEGQIRVLFFFFSGKRIILTHGFVKKTQKAPRKEIEIAQERRKDFLMRNKYGGLRPMKKVDDYIKEKLRRNPDFKVRCDLINEKAVVAKRIIAYRIRHKLSQEQLAKEIGVTQQYISKIEEGEFSNLDTIENVLEHIGYRLKLEVVPA